MNYIDINNFENKLGQIRQEIQKCDFVSFDFEFSALNINLNDKLTQYDSIEEQYQKTKFLCLNSHILQFGLSFFVWDGKNNNYKSQCYSFYLETKGFQGFQSKSYKFLAGLDYDFKRTFLYGIPFKQIYGKKQPQNDIDINIHYKQDIQQEIERIKQIIIDSKQYKTKIDCPNQEVLNILIKQQVQEKQFKGLLRFTLTKYNENTLYLVKNQNEFKVFGEPEQPKEIEFQIVIDELIKQRKILIGHNASIDLCLFYQNFIDDLPNNFIEFGIQFQKLIPLVLDTKIISNYFREQFNLQKKMQNHIDSLFKECYINDKGLKPFNNVIINFDFIDIYKTKGLHDAGYDSLITGVCCICMANMLNQGKKQQIELEKQYQKQINKFHSFGYEIEINNPNQSNLYENEKFIYNTLYGEVKDNQGLDYLVEQLTKYFTIEKTRIQDQFFLTIENNQLPNLEELCQQFQHIQGIMIVPYQKRKKFRNIET